MKPLELTVWARNENYPGASNVVYEHPDGLVAVGDLFVDAEAHEKRLTDAELAAEAWAAQCNRRVRNYDPTQDIPGVTWEWEHSIMARFAMLPHYDEATE